MINVMDTINCPTTSPFLRNEFLFTVNGILDILFYKVYLGNIYFCSDTDTNCSIMDMKR